MDRLYDRAEGVTAFISSMAVTMNIDWTDKVATFFLAISSGMISGLLANIMKQLKLSEWVVRKSKKMIKKFNIELKNRNKKDE